MIKRVVIFGLFLAFYLVWASGAQANTRKYASIVVDAESLEIIHARQIDASRFPASLTKVMTLYLTFDALNNGSLNLDESLLVSRHAANAPPSKLGLRAGQRISVRDAIQALTVKSANDVAIVLAERLAGSEPAFTDRMTQKATELGMMRTVFKTASGLPHPDQRTTARDMAKLASSMLQNHRRYYHFFGQNTFRYNGRHYRNTNSLLGSVAGVDGFKTGYTFDSGYNLIISAQRDGRRIIAVVLGGASGKSRDQHMRDLIDRGFDVLDNSVFNPTVSVAKEYPRNDPRIHKAGTEIVNLRRSDQAVISVRSGNSDIRYSGTHKSENWAIQLGAFDREQTARNHIANLASGLAHSIPEENGEILPVISNERRLFRARITRLSFDRANQICKALENSATECLIVANQ